MFDRLNINPTQWTGLISFAVATFACLIAARRSESRNARIWKVLALINCLFALETCIGMRHHIHNVVKAWFMEVGLYSQHRVIQEITIILFAAIALIFVALPIFKWLAGSTARAGACITMAVVALFVIEGISHDTLDAIFYLHVGPIYLIGWLWASAAIAVCLATIQRHSEHSG